MGLGCRERKRPSPGHVASGPSWGWNPGLLTLSTELFAACFLILRDGFLHMVTTCQDLNTPSLSILTPLRDRHSIFLICQTRESRWTSSLGQAIVSCKTQLHCDPLGFFLISQEPWVCLLTLLSHLLVSPLQHPSYGMVNIWPMSDLRVSFFFLTGFNLG